MTRAGGLLLFLLAVLASRATAQMGSLTDLDREFVKVVREVAPAVVWVQPGISGVCVSDDGFVLTDGVVGQVFAKSKAQTVKVTFPSQTTYDASLHAADAESGTVILKIDTRARLPAVRPGDPGELQVGHFLMTVGNAFGMAAESEPAVTLGVVSSIRRDPQGRPLLMETSAATNPGQHGGPYFNTDGRLVGLFRALPNGQDLATVTPIDLIRSAYSKAPDAERIFDRTSSLRPPRTKANILSQAFHIAASRARRGVVTLVIERRPEADGEEGKTDVATADETEKEEGRGKKGKRQRRPQEPPSIPRRDGPVTGTIIDTRGFVLAPESAFGDDVESIVAHLHDGRSFRASVVSRDRKSNLALLLLDRGPDDILEVLEHVPQERLEIGQFVIAVAAPHGPPVEQDPFVTVGLLSARGRLDTYRDALETDAGVNVKNAGGLLVDLRGRMLGVILQPEMPYGQNSGLGFAMPVSAIQEILPRLMEGRDVEPAYIGVVLGDAPGGREGALVNEVTAGFPGAEAGLQQGDLITHLDGIALPNRQALTNYLWKYKSPGDVMKVTIQRHDQELEVTVTLTKRPES